MTLLAATPLSQSPIWQLQRDSYDRLGIESWAEGRVPFYTTNNSRIAAQYVDIICSAFRHRSFTVLELGGGSGKFAFLLIGELLRCNISNFQYLLTDAAEKNIAFWRHHPLLNRQIEQGILQTSVLNPLDTDLPRADLIIANYFFDSIPHDLFRVENGELFEGIVSLRGTKSDWKNPFCLSQLQMAYDFRAIENDPYPDFPAAGQILNMYRTRFKTGSFLFPIGPLRVLRRVQRNQPVRVLVADKGIQNEREVSSMPLMPAFHGSAFSFPVNFHAIGLFTAMHAGIDLTVFSDGALLSLNTYGSHFEEILQRLVEANWDATLFFSFFDQILTDFSSASSAQKEIMLSGMRRIRERFFPLFREEALALERLGLFLREIGEEDEAERSLRMAHCLQSLPSQSFWIERFLSFHPPIGDVLQIGEIEGTSHAILSMQSSSYHFLSWGDSINEKQIIENKLFDVIFLFPPPLISQRKKPTFIREIEAAFALDTIKYSDVDIDAFFSSLARISHRNERKVVQDAALDFENREEVNIASILTMSGLSKDEAADCANFPRLCEKCGLASTNATEIFSFFSELGRKKNISQAQLENIAKRLGQPVCHIKDDQFFETLKLCLHKYIKLGGSLHAFLPRISTYEDSRFFDEIVIDPFLEYKETQEARGLWISLVKEIPNTN